MIGKKEDLEVELIGGNGRQFLQILSESAIPFHQDHARFRLGDGCPNRPGKAIAHAGQAFIRHQDLPLFLGKGLHHHGEGTPTAAGDHHIAWAAKCRKVDRKVVGVEKSLGVTIAGF